ncbi:MAG TPA: chemotaxis protein CheW [Calditrichia bacterium]|nr:purine-binding chemotaxis protein CheW [Calditrichota bacterium]HQU71513.1 chemotaxis protein CheW [Calditrichia bacterium]HQV30270.1 chemotaxis protein CheW [Calditrichia bacterium]
MKDFHEQQVTILTFRLREELYGIDVFRVREVVEYLKPAMLPVMPDYLKGVIDLRGEAIPILDLRTKFNMKARESDAQTSFIILEGKIEEEEMVFGAMVDGVREVVDLAPDAIKAPPRFDQKARAEYLSGITRHQDNFILVIDTDSLLTLEQAEAMREAAEQAGELSTEMAEALEVGGAENYTPG